MLLNHKDALDFVLDVPDYLKELSVHRIEDIHSILTKELEVDRNIRHRRVGITGTNYPKSVIRISLCRTAKRNPLIFPI